MLIFALPFRVVRSRFAGGFDQADRGTQHESDLVVPCTPGGKTTQKDGKRRFVYDPKGDFLSMPGEETSNSDNFTIDPGKTHVMLEADGPA